MAVARARGACSKPGRTGSAVQRTVRGGAILLPIVGMAPHHLLPIRSEVESMFGPLQGKHGMAVGGTSHLRGAGAGQFAQDTLYALGDFDHACAVARDGRKGIVKHIVNGERRTMDPVVQGLARRRSVVPGAKEPLHRTQDCNRGAGIVDAGGQGTARYFGQHDEAETGIFVEVAQRADDECLA